MSTAALVVHNPQSMDIAPRHVALLRPIATPAEVVTAQEEARELVAKALKKDRDYGIIPGTGKKASLLKPGAERVALAFGCYYGEPEIIEKEYDHDRLVQWQKRKKKWEGQGENRSFTWEQTGRGESIGLYRYVLRVPVIHRESGQVVGYGLGSCSTMESKYVENPRDAENTVFKMAHKRAIVSACLVTFGLSDQFTQDVEDMPRDDADERADGGGSAPARSDDPGAKCPKCQGLMWDNRTTKTNPKAPDYKCRDKGCDGVYWPGQWPPAAVPMASAELRDELAKYAADPRVTKAVREKLLAFDGQELTQEKAMKWVEKLQAKYPAEVADGQEDPTSATRAGVSSTNASVPSPSEPDIVKAAAEQQRRAEAPKHLAPNPVAIGGDDSPF